MALAPKRRPGLFGRYAVLFASLVCGALLTSALIETYFGYREHRAALVAIQQERVLSAASRIEQFVAEIARQVDWAGQDRIMAAHMTIEQRRVELLRLLRQAPAVTEVRRVDAAGREEIRLSRLAMDVVGSGADLSNRPEFRGAHTSHAYFGPVSFRVESEPYMTIAVRSAGKSGGVTAADVNLKFIWDVVRRVKVGEAGSAYVLDAEGRLIAHPDISLVLRKTDLSHMPVIQAEPTELSGEARPKTAVGRGLSGQPALMSMAPIGSLGWVAFVEQPREEVFAPLYASVARTALLLLAGLALSIGASLLLARRMVAPIRALQAGAARIGAGELNERIEVRTQDEIGALADEFNRMAVRLGESYAGLERKVAERTRELEATNAAKSRFLAAASHDLRQPLQAMALFISALQGKDRNPDTRPIVDRLAASVEALEGLFHALLDVSRLDAGIVRPELGDLRVQTLFDRIESEYAAEAAEKGLRLRMVPTRAVARSDAMLLERILRNLVSNAIHYTRRGGLLVGCRRRGDALRIDVLDSGIGIDPSHQKEIFQEFYQIGNPERDRSKGLGLGLAIVNRLAALLNHSIEVRSLPGRGSVFSVRVPRGDPAGVLVDAPRAEEFVGAKLDGALVVVIDNEQAVLDGMREVLQQWGARPLLASSAGDALAQLAASGRRPDAVIADYRLGSEETGIQAIERVRADHGPEVPGVLITGDTAVERLREAQASGYHLLHKPVRPVKLCALLSFLLSA